MKDAFVRNLSGSCAFALVCGLVATGCGSNQATVGAAGGSGSVDASAGHDSGGGSSIIDASFADTSTSTSTDATVDQSSANGSDDASIDTGAPSITNFAIACNDAIADVYKPPTNLPAFTLANRGDVVRCAPDRTLSQTEVGTAMTSLGYPGPTLPSGVSVFRITYRTQRVNGTGGTSSALVFVPELPHAQGASPLVVAGHGSLGIANSCAPSLGDLLVQDDRLGDVHALDLGLAGFGWYVIAPDYAGLGTPGTATGWLSSPDEAYSLLDATRAMNNLLKAGTLSSHVALVGHSQGGHAVISAETFQHSYGLQGTLDAVIAFAPVWFSAATWGGATTSIAGLTTANDSGAIAYSMEYFYGHGELYDGPGGGLTMFDSSKRAQIGDLLSTSCTPEDFVSTLGVDPSDIYDATFIDEMTACAGAGICFAAGDWGNRFTADRPTIDPAGGSLVIWQGAMDQTVTPDRAQCGFDKIRADLSSATSPTTTLSVCSMDWVNHFIAQKTLGELAPAACGSESLLGNQTCPTPPSNN
jgi:hypothetical protein